MSLDFIVSILNTGLIGIAVAAAVWFMMRYLNRGEGPYQLKELTVLRDELKVLRNDLKHSPSHVDVYLERLSEEINALKTTQQPINLEQQEELAALIRKRLNDDAAQHTLSEIKERVAKETGDRDKLVLIEESFQSTIDRLRQELFALSKRGNLNLSIGIITTITGLVLLGMFVLTDSTPKDNATQFAINFVPRISLVILIEVFAYFFLRLYKSGLSEIKYFQNEITTIESKYLALKVAVSVEDSNNLNNVVNKLSETERNFILDKGQSTVDLERTKIESQSASDILGKITSLLGKYPNK